MKRIYGLASGIALLAAGAAAQDGAQMKVELERMLATSKMVAAGGGVMGRHVKGAPYSAEEVSESSQTLGDGTRIRNESRALVYRDGEGRVRRENGDHVTIWDPVANVNYSINTKNMTAVKSSMNVGFATMAKKFEETRAIAGAMASAGPAHRIEGGSTGSVSVRDGIVTVTKDGKTQTFPVGPDGTWVSDDGKMRASSRQWESGTPAVAGVAGARVSTFEARDHVTITKEGHAIAAPPDGLTYPIEGRVRMLAPAMAVAGGGAGNAFFSAEPLADVKTEALGDQVIEGVKARGSRLSSTIEAGKIGNDRALTSINERWYSDELQVEVLSKRTDPRNGDHTFRLTNINRAEPASYLFQAPSGYTVTERK